MRATSFHSPHFLIFSLLFLLPFLFSSSTAQTLSMRRLLPSYQFNNRTEVFLAVLPQPLSYYAPSDPTPYTSAANPIIQFHSYSWWPSSGGGAQDNDTYLIDGGSATTTTVPVVLISGSDVQTTGYNYSTSETYWGPTITANPLNGNSPSLDCDASVGCSSRTTGIMYLFGGFAPASYQHRYSVDGGKTWNNSGVDLQLFSGTWGLADPRCEVDPISGQVMLFSGLRYAYLPYSNALINTVWVNPGGGEPTTDPTLWTVQCASAPWPARSDASSTIWYSPKMGHSIVWLANGHQVGFQYGYEVVTNASSATGYTVVSPGTNDIWTSPNLGRTWDLVTLAAPYIGRTGARMAVSDGGTLVLAEGSADYSDIFDIYPHDVWASADGGVTWGLCAVNSTSYAPRRAFGMTIDHSGYLWFSSGQYDLKYKEPADDNADILVSAMSFDDPVALQTHCGITVSPCGIGARCYPVTAPCPCYPSSSSSPIASSSVSSSPVFSSSPVSSSAVSSSVASSSVASSSAVSSSIPSSSVFSSSVISSSLLSSSLFSSSPPSSSLHSSSVIPSSSPLSSSLSPSSSPIPITLPPTAPFTPSSTAPSTSHSTSSFTSTTSVTLSPPTASPTTSPLTSSITSPTLSPFTSATLSPTTAPATSSTSTPTTSPLSPTTPSSTSLLFPTSTSSTAVIPPPPTSSSSSFPVGAIIGIVVGVVSGCCLCLLLLFVCYRRRKEKNTDEPEILSPTLSPKGSTPSVQSSGASSGPRFSAGELELGRALPSVGSSYNSFPSSSAFVSGGTGDSDGVYRTQDLTSGGSEELHLSSVVYVH